LFCNLLSSDVNALNTVLAIEQTKAGVISNVILPIFLCN